MPIHINDSINGDNMLGTDAKFDPMAFKTSAEAVKTDIDGLSFNAATTDYMGRSLTAPAPTDEQRDFASQQWSPDLEAPAFNK